MKVLFQGAFNNNFGDNLFTKLFFDSARKVLDDEEIFFSESGKYGITDRLATEIGYQKKGRVKNADVLVYFSGGYFGERRNNVKEALGRYWVYCRIANKFRNKPILIISVGAGPISNRFLQKKIVDIFNNSKVAIVRDEESKRYLQEYGVKKDIIVSSDTAQIINITNVPLLNKDIKSKIDGYKNKKRIFFHLSQLRDDEVLKIAEAIRIFSEENQYLICFGFDGFSLEKESRKKITNELTEKFGTQNCYYYEYEDSMAFCSFLNEMDIVVTPKLHVGIVSCSLEKSVIAFPHHQKISRYYSQIGHAERCYKLEKLSVSDIVEVLKTYKDSKIHIPEECIIRSNNNLDILMNELIELKHNLNI